MIKIKINSRFLFCREDEDERHKACLCWKGYVHIGRKTAHFETLHIQEPVVQKSSSFRLTCTLFLQHYCMPLLLGHKCSAHLNAWKCACKIYTGVEGDTNLICWRRNLINDFCYKGSINMQSREWTKDGFCGVYCCWSVQSLLRALFETCHFPSDSAACR